MEPTALGMWDGDSQNADDIRRKFSGTFLDMTIPEVYRAPQVVHFTDVDGDLAYYRTSEEGTRRQAFYWREAVVHRYMPDLGAVQVSPHAILFAKKRTQRQWQLGFGGGSVVMWDDTLQSHRDWSTSVAEKFYNPVYPEGALVDRLAVCMQRFQADPTIRSQALDSIYWLRHTGKNTTTLYRNVLPLGSFNFGQFFVQKPCTIFAQELYEHFNIQVAT